MDWIAFTFTPSVAEESIAWTRHVLTDVFCVPSEDWISKGRGWNGYTTRFDLGPFGLLAYGGPAQRGTFHVELTGQGCRFVRDWNAVRLWGESFGAVITRVDLAHDDFSSAQISVEQARRWLEEGRFNASGRPPAAELIDDLGSNKGKTLYIGQRASGKLLRVYEKGKQLGDKTSEWVRAEVELRNKGRFIPWSVVTSAETYLAGAYPALGFLSTEQDRLRTTQRASGDKLRGDGQDPPYTGGKVAQRYEHGQRRGRMRGANSARQGRSTEAIGGLLAG